MVNMLNEHVVDSKPEEFDFEEESSCPIHRTKMDCVACQCSGIYSKDLVAGGWVISVYCEPPDWERPMYWHEYFRSKEVAEQMEYDLNFMQCLAEYG